MGQETVMLTNVCQTWLTNTSTGNGHNVGQPAGHRLIGEITMIEMRWITYPERELQFREFTLFESGIPITKSGWSDWKTVPVVEPEDNEA